MPSPQRRILVVEDHADTRELLVLVLSDCGYGVKATSTISEALKLIRDEDFSLLLFDSKLPDGSGVDLCRSVREFDQKTPIVFSSGLAYEKDKRTALDAGAQVYLVKPIDIAELVKSITELILKERKFPVMGETTTPTSGRKRPSQLTAAQPH